jgi:hypothetical protein
VKITAGALLDKGIEVLAGLNPGDRILAAGVHFVSKGQRVRPLDARAGE